LSRAPESVTGSGYQVYVFIKPAIRIGIGETDPKAIMQCTDEGDTNTLWGSDGSAIVWLNDGLGTDVFPTFDIFSTSETKEGVQVAPAGPVRNGEGNAVEGRLSSRERQKRYRERQKLKLNTIRNQFNEVSAEYEAVLTENIELKQSNSALEALAAYGSAMLNMIASSALHSYHEFRNLSAVSLEYLKGLHGAIVDKVLQSRLSCQDLISVWDSLTIAGHRRYVLSLWLIHIANILKEVRNSVCKVFILSHASKYAFTMRAVQ
jgi:hypothetical protein